MQLEITETNSAVTQRLAFLNIRWGGIFAGLAVGLATNMLLMLIGAAAGLSLYDVGEEGGASIPVTASIWNSVSMIVSAFVGGYVAARASGFKRSSDGILHAAVAWGMTMLLAALLASTVTGATFNAIFPTLQRGGMQDTAQVLRSVEQGDRQAASESLQRNLGISSDQANQMIDQALALSGREENVGASGRAAAQDTVRTAAAVSIWLTLSTILSLLSSLAGGLTGVRGSRRILHRRVTSMA